MNLFRRGYQMQYNFPTWGFFCCWSIFSSQLGSCVCLLSGSCAQAAVLVFCTKPHLPVPRSAPLCITQAPSSRLAPSSAHARSAEQMPPEFPPAHNKCLCRGGIMFSAQEHKCYLKIFISLSTALCIQRNKQFAKRDFKKVLNVPVKVQVLNRFSQELFNIWILRAFKS